LGIITAGNESAGDFGAPQRFARNDGEERNGDSWGQETVGERFPVRLGNNAIHGGRKLKAKGFLSDVEAMRFMGGRKLLAKGFLSDAGTV
jgi:hypothetical protein